MVTMHLNLIFLFLFYLAGFVRCQTDGKIEPASNGTLISISECFYLYFKNGLIQLHNENVMYTLGPIKSATGTCEMGNETKNSDIQIEFSAPPNTSNYSKLVLNLNLDQPDEASGYWKASKATAELTTASGVEEMDLLVEDITSLDRFSFSCSELVLRNKKEKGPRSITLNNFQLQGFTGKIFEESFDCSTWFTLSMFAGLVVILMFLTIITLGICFLVSVQTNDRFEDPRGKPLIINTSD